ncbi:MAG: NAD-dependent epimerase/dehydratase family protein [Rubripirellula sp.]
MDELICKPSAEVLEAVRRCEGNFVVLGAGGKMGFHLSRLLQRSLQILGRADTITVVSRFSSGNSSDPFRDHGFDVLPADISDPDQLKRIPDAANVLFLAGIKFGTSGDSGLLEKMNSQMPRAVAQRFCKSRIVALSTGCVYSFTSPESGGSTEQSDTDPPGEYAQSCLGRERAFVDGSLEHGTPCSLVRLNYAIDLRYGVLVDIAQQVKAGVPVNLQTGYVNVIWQGDAAAQILQCFPKTNSPPWIINVTGSQTLRVRDLAEQFAIRFGTSAKFEGTEASACWLNDSTLARQTFGEPTVSVEQMIDWIADWIEQDGQTLGKPTHFQTRDGNY